MKRRIDCLMVASFAGLAGGDNQLEDAIVGRKVGIVYKIVDRRGLLGIPSGHNAGPAQQWQSQRKTRRRKESQAVEEEGRQEGNMNPYQLGDAVGPVRNAQPWNRAEPRRPRPETEHARVAPLLDLGVGACSFAVPSRINRPRYSMLVASVGPQAL